ncbi:MULTISPECIES: DUF885 domain-containing protein [Maribacter]|uniref:DUF885 domain-containing protein n=1 Tax=Maribacter flavus TaxID=1658664 RepID=A0ABU7IGA1_9FLAO|nr:MULTISPECIES: DUF885 domain-containing protein [Maribacter]MDC6405330.1 DUF885 domain-containing protein [Maribacter sp. PR66]MEE1971861.1 DUF885 domain-containing protein [Maribacter flavus]
MFAQKQALEKIIGEVEAFELYDRSEFPLGRYLPEVYKKDANFAQEQLAKLESIETVDLSETVMISLELLKFSLQNRVDEYKHELYLNPIQADQGFHLSLNYRIRPLRDYESARQYLKALNDMPRFAEEHFQVLRMALEKKVSQPKVIFEGYESTYNQHITENISDNAFYGPFKDLPSSLTTAQKDSILGAAKVAIEAAVVPTFKKIKDFFESEYLPNTRNTFGISDTPGGAELYQNRVNYYTTTNTYTAEDVHQIGLKEVARIRSEMEEIIKAVGFKGSFADFLEFLRTDPQFYVTNGEDLLKEARNIAKQIDAKLPAYFSTLPRKPYGVIKVPDALAPKYTGGRYSGSRSPTEPGYYLVNTYKLDSRPLYVLPSLTLHEAVPGHHLQGSLNQEMSDSIPQFRRNMYLSAFGEGWALYTEFLGDEMGMYKTPYEKFGKLTYEMWRATRLVVDTGIHAKGWTKQQVLDFMKNNTALSLHEINTETDRYIAWPGQALSYKMGELKIRELRTKAEEELGPDFNIREFHEVILGQGTVTLPILERRVNDYIKSKKS